MKKKKLFSFIVLVIMTGLCCQNVYASSIIPQKNVQEEINIDEEDNNTYSEAAIIKKFSLKNKLQRSPESQITSFFKKYNNYAQKEDIEKLRNMYSDNFVNNDGFDKETVFKLMASASDSYKNIEYTTYIDNIKINGQYAVVQAHETARAETNNLASKIDDTGLVVSEIDFIDNLVKEGNQWKIITSEILSEKVVMKYGEAKNMDITIEAPASVPSGSQYEVSISANTPDGTFAIGSIVNEPITFPQTETKDIYRAIKSEKLARVLTANNDNHNEYTTISIALTRADIEPPAVNINMTGMAFAMQRINIVQKNIKKEGKDVKQNS